VSLGRRTAYNLLGAIAPTLLSLVTIPIYIRAIGDARYGALAVLWSLLGYFGLADLGLGRATAQRIASLDSSSPRARSACLWTALFVEAALGLLGALLIWLAAWVFVGRIMAIEPALQSEFAPALVWLASLLPAAMLANVLGGALEGRSRFLELNLISLAGAVLFQLLPLAVALAIGPELCFLLPAVLCARATSVLLAFWRCKIHVLGEDPPTFSTAEAKALLRFGGWFTVSNVISPFMVMLDRFVIGAGAGAKAVTYYSVPFQLAERSNLVASALTGAMLPELARADADERRRLAAQAIRALAVATAPMIVMAILFVEPFFQVWLGPEFAARANVADQILLIGFWCNGLAMAPFAQLLAAGRPNLTARCHVLELAPYILLLVLGLTLWGLPGAALAFALRAFGDLVLLLHFGENLKRGLDMVRTPLVLLLLALAVALLASGPFGHSPWRWISSLGLVAATSAWSWRNCPPAWREAGTRLLRKPSDDLLRARR